MSRKIPTKNILIARIVIEVVSFLVLVYPMAHIYVFLKGEKEPYHR